MFICQLQFYSNFQDSESHLLENFELEIIKYMMQFLLTWKKND